MKLWVAAALTAALTGAGAGIARAELVTNGGFETGVFTGWTVNATGTGVAGTDGTHVPHSGAYLAYLGDASNAYPYGTLSQTISDTAGETLSLTYWLASDGGTPNYFDATWNGSTLSGSVVTDLGRSSYVEYTFNVTATGSDVLLFHEQNIAAYLSLDDVSLTPAAAVPEPISMALLGTGLLGLGLARRRRQ